MFEGGEYLGVVFDDGALDLHERRDAALSVPSAETCVIWAERRSPRTSKNVASVALSRPGPARPRRADHCRGRRPRSNARGRAYRRPASTPIRRRSANWSWGCSTSSQTGVMIAPTVRQAIRMSFGDCGLGCLGG